MPKLKTNRGAAKRFRVTASGKIKLNKAKRRHILTKKTRKMKRQARAGGYVADVDVPNVRRLLPYG
ncbi:MAG: 50S ribosomal protein L35 [Deltaproteobacteria bacterium]|nr:50S ribosomal protein L35 [Deltaproteobacteria bacterium]